MTLFFKRVIGALALDPATYEEIEADRHSAMQSVIVLLAVTLAGGGAAIGLGLVGIAGFVTGAIVMLGGWLTWVSLISTLGTTVLAEPQTRSNARELLRTLGFASAPGIFLVFAVMRTATPLIVAIVSIWMIAAAVLAVRQALDFRSTPRAIAVCVVSWLVALGILLIVGSVFARPVS